jgi:threonine/homoserine/homoserine lactone efflux protein
MPLTYLLKGLIIGFSIAAPVGPIGILCIQRTIASGRASGLVTGLGAASADALYGCVAGFGLTWVSQFLLAQKTWLQLGGGAFLAYLGLKAWMIRPGSTSQAASTPGFWHAYLSTFFLTLTNPMTILSFMAVFAGLGIAATSGNYRDAASLVLGVFCGSALWWLLLSSGIGIFRSRPSAGSLRWIDRLSGTILLVFAVVAIWGILE